MLPGEKAPDFTLISQNGNSVSLSEFSGNPVFITFIYTSCEASCSLILNNKDLIEQKLKAQTGLDAAFLAITVDPIRDSVSTLKNYLKMTGIPEKNLTLLTGETGDVKRVLTAYKIKVARWKETGEVAGHPNIGYVVGQNGLIEDVFVLDG
ncbi:MAG: SCO family protein [Nitrospinota bacterium]